MARGWEANKEAIDIIAQELGIDPVEMRLRNVIHDLKLPLFLIVGVRSYHAHQKGQSKDSCPVFTEPIMQTWQIPYTLLDTQHSAADLARAYRDAEAQQRAAAVLIAE